MSSTFKSIGAVIAGTGYNRILDGPTGKRDIIKQVSFMVNSGVGSGEFFSLFYNSAANLNARTMTLVHSGLASGGTRFKALDDFLILNSGDSLDALSYSASSRLGVLISYLEQDL